MENAKCSSWYLNSAITWGLQGTIQKSAVCSRPSYNTAYQAPHRSCGELRTEGPQTPNSRLQACPTPDMQLNLKPEKLQHVWVSCNLGCGLKLVCESLGLVTRIWCVRQALDFKAGNAKALREDRSKEASYDMAGSGV